MEISHFGTKGTHVDRIKKYIYSETLKGNHLNDKHTVSQNRIFEAVVNREGPLTSSSSQYSTPQ
jgi:hypothetical protein